MRFNKFSTLVLIALLTLYSSLALGQLIRVEEVVGKSKPALNRQKGIKMLKEIREVLETHYYDKNFKGIDLDEKIEEATERIKKLETNAQIFRVIAGVLLEFNDSHTTFYTPDRSNRVEYGFAMQMIGEHRHVVNVKKGSDAEGKGMKVGDRISRIGQYDVTRENLWVLNYFIYRLEPTPVLPVVVVDASGKQKSLEIQASFKSLEDRKKEAEARRKVARESPYKCSKISAALTACKLRSFVVEKKYVDQMMKEAVAGSKLILDLRGNRGGYVRMEEYLTGHFFDREVKIGEMVYRTRTRTSVAKPVSDRQFKGELIVLTDSNSASASEVFARLIQIEKRGKVVGDVSAGAVMTSYNLSMAVGRGADEFQTITPFGMNVTVADLIMSDGGRLEHTGVVPDHPVGPTGFAIASKNDPVLAFAAKLLGEKLTPEDAGKLEFLFKKAEDDDHTDAKANNDDDQP